MCVFEIQQETACFVEETLRLSEHPTRVTCFFHDRVPEVPVLVVAKKICPASSRIGEQAILNVISLLHHGRLKQCIAKLPLGRNHRTIPSFLDMTCEVKIASGVQTCVRQVACVCGLVVPCGDSWLLNVRHESERSFL